MDPRRPAGGDGSTDDPRIIAHSGFAGVAPENTLAAFRAIADGTHPAAMVELDVVPCADGTPVVFHDARLDGDGDGTALTDLDGLVWETPLEELTNASILGTGEPIPTLRQALEVLPSDVGVNVELKNPGSSDLTRGKRSVDAVETSRDRWEPFVEAVVETLATASGDVLVSSFYEPAIASIRDFAPEVPVALLLAVSIRDGLEVAERYECEAIHPRINMIRGTPFFEEPRGRHTDPSFEDIDVVDAAADIGCEVNVWTIRSWREADWLRSSGVDGVIADHPRLFSWRSEAE